MVAQINVIRVASVFKFNVKDLFERREHYLHHRFPVTVRVVCYIFLLILFFLGHDLYGPIPDYDVQTKACTRPDEEASVLVTSSRRLGHGLGTRRN